MKASELSQDKKYNEITDNLGMISWICDADAHNTDGGRYLGAESESPRTTVQVTPEGRVFIQIFSTEA